VSVVDVVPVITSAVSVAGAFVSAAYARRAVSKDRREAADQLVVRFTEPLLQATFNLQTRIYNIVELKFFERFHNAASPAEDREYAVLNTLYVVAQYFCWIEILRRDSQFVDPRNNERTVDLVRGLENIRDAFANSYTIDERCFRIFRGEQRALGELMLVPVVNPSPGVPRWECLGYAPFVSALDDPKVARWFGKLRQDIEILVGDTAARDARLREIQRRLVDVIDAIDPRQRRVPAHLRHRLAPATGERSHTPAGNACDV
jgi:hypothetical protein